MPARHSRRPAAAGWARSDSWREQQQAAVEQRGDRGPHPGEIGAFGLQPGPPGMRRSTMVPSPAQLSVADAEGDDQQQHEGADQNDAAG